MARRLGVFIIGPPIVRDDVVYANVYHARCNGTGAGV